MSRRPTATATMATEIVATSSRMSEDRNDTLRAASAVWR